MGKLIDTKELCDIFKITTDTAYNWRKKRGLPYRKYTAKSIRYDLDEVMKWKSDHEEK